MKIYDKPLFIFEMANNHQGSTSHGIEIIRALKRVCIDFEDVFQFAVKFQYRQLSTFIHKDSAGNMEIKNVKRFQDTKLEQEEFQQLIDETRAQNFFTICTPFDEPSVDKIVEQEFDVIKIASCSFTDWPLLEKIAKQNKPVIASAAGSSMEDIEKVVSFFKHRGINFSLMHCVAEYPTINSHLQMNQIDLYKEKFKHIRIGFSTHEEPGNLEPVKLAVAKGAEIFEKHVGLPTETESLNGYSANPDQIKNWLAAAREVYEICGVKGVRYQPEEKEKKDLLALQRGVFAKKTLSAGSPFDMDDVYLAFPCQPGQLLASDLSKYNLLSLKEEMVLEDGAIMLSNVEIKDRSALVHDIVVQVIETLRKSNVMIPVNSSCEISHHYGIDSFFQTGVTMIDCINREYCKKILVVLPGQSHPFHLHKKKEETFTVLYGELEATCDGVTKIVNEGESMVVERFANHNFGSTTGCVFEEISTTHYPDDSYYEDSENFVNPRKTKVYLTKDMLKDFK